MATRSTTQPRSHTAPAKQPRKSRKVATESESDSTQTDRAATDLSNSTSNQLNANVSQSRLFEALSFVVEAASRKPTHPVLANVLIKGDATTNQIWLTCTDLATTLTARIDADVERPGTVTAPANLLKEVVAKCPAGTLILNSQAKGQAVAVVVTDPQAGVVELDGLAADEFPTPEAIAQPKPVILNAKALAIGLKSVLFAVAREQAKGVLTGVNWHLQDDRLTCTATDGLQIAIAHLDLKGIGRSKRTRKTEAIHCSLSASAVKAVTKAIEGMEVDECNVTYDDRTQKLQVQVESDRLHHTITTQALQGDYPDVLAIINQRFNFTRSATLGRGDFVERLSRLSALTHRDKHDLLLTFEGSTQTLTLTIEQAGSKGRQVIEATLDQPDSFAIKLNIHQLLTMLKSLGSTGVRLWMDRPDTITKLEAVGDFEVKDLVMTATYFTLPFEPATHANAGTQEPSRVSNADGEPIDEDDEEKANAEDDDAIDEDEDEEIADE
ncbi:MAG: DNA polymerase III subunit beta [Leptolyngbyaceae cyanobacterium bins.302]|nr:DNA polymerase III subunit beta [Leptolyngbyaceae cyanobacterium bins.302]